MKIRLIIDGKTADLNEDNLVVMTYQATDAEKPAAVKNSYSQNVTLPATPTNDAIFSHILRSDFRTRVGFNPLARTPFEIRNEAQEILVKGYLRLNEGTYGENYSVTLFGGLGGFFYGLMYSADGEKKTLADIHWWNGQDWLGKTNTIPVNATGVKNRWAYFINHPTEDGEFYCFAPCYNGYPEDFDSNKGYYKKDESVVKYADLFDSVTEGGKTYGPKNGIGKGILVELGQEQNEWEVQDLRSYLQRPVWSVYEFFRSICNKTYNGGFDVELDPHFFHDNNPYYRYAWCSMPLLDKTKITAGGNISLANFFAGTDSPAEYLLSYAKQFGLIFVYDEPAMKVRIMMRNTYYREMASQVINLSPILAQDRGVTISPLLMSAKWERVQSEVIGANGEKYEQQYGKKYGSIWVNTGYPFGDETEDVFKDVVFKSSPDTLENGLGYRVFVGASDPQFGDATAYQLKQRLTAEVKWQLYYGTKDEAKECTPTLALDQGWYLYNTSPDYYDNIPKIQLHDADNGAEDGKNVLLFYTGAESLPYSASHPTWEAVFSLSDDNADMLDLNGGKPCWDLTHRQANLVAQIPSFRRYLEFDGDWWLMEWSEPKEVYVPGDYYGDAENLYDAFWRELLTDRYDVDGRRMKCWVNLRTALTPKVDTELLRRFWYYDGAYWVLNKITSHSLATDDLTECEFIKVKKRTAYTNGQYAGLMPPVYLFTADGEKVMTADGEYVRVNTD